MRMRELKMDREWQGLFHSLTDRYDNFKLELLRAWEPGDSSRTLPLSEGKMYRYGFPNGNQVA